MIISARVKSSYLFIVEGEDAFIDKGLDDGGGGVTGVEEFFAGDFAPPLSSIYT